MKSEKEIQYQIDKLVVILCEENDRTLLNIAFHMSRTLNWVIERNQREPSDHITKSRS